MKAHVVIFNKGADQWVYSNFKKGCLALGLPYHDMKRLKFPISWEEFSIEKKSIL